MYKLACGLSHTLTCTLSVYLRYSFGCVFTHCHFCYVSAALDVNCEDNVQRTPLHYAAMCNRVGAAKVGCCAMPMLCFAIVS